MRVGIIRRLRVCRVTTATTVGPTPTAFGSRLATVVMVVSVFVEATKIGGFGAILKSAVLRRAIAGSGLGVDGQVGVPVTPVGEILVFREALGGARECVRSVSLLTSVHFVGTPVPVNTFARLRTSRDLGAVGPSRLGRKRVDPVCVLLIPSPI